jgi:hypothetical protein
MTTSQCQNQTISSFVFSFFFSLTSRNIIIELDFIRGGIHGAVSHEQSAENGTDVFLGRNSSQSCTSIYFEVLLSFTTVPATTAVIEKESRPE